MSDADVDGFHIRTLWMTYIYRYMRPLIANGHLYLAQPPLYKVYKNSKGKEISKYAYSDEELEKVKSRSALGHNIKSRNKNFIPSYNRRCSKSRKDGFTSYG